MVAAGGGGDDDVGKKVCALFHRNGSNFGNKLYCRKNPVIEGNAERRKNPPLSLYGIISVIITTATSPPKNCRHFDLII